MGVIELGNVEILAVIVSYFKVIEIVIKVVNFSFEIDWDNVFVFILLRILDI